MGLQQTLQRLVFKLPPGLLVRMSGGRPIEIGGRTLDPHLQVMAHAARDAPPIGDTPAEAVQAQVKEQLAAVQAARESGVSAEDRTIPSRGAHELPVRIYRPKDQDASLPLMVYFHMGGGVVGDLETSDAFCSILASKVRVPVMSVNYRLAPQHKFPAGLEDCIDAYEWALGNAKYFGAPAGQAMVGGDSMGGNFSAILSQEMRRQNKTLPALQLLIYPATDMTQEMPSRALYADTFSLSTEMMNWFMEQYLPDDFDRADLRLSPAQETVLEGLPPAVVATAGFDPLVDEGDAYAGRLKAAGVPVRHMRFDGLAHAFTAFTRISPASRQACLSVADSVADLLAETCGKS